MKHLLYTLLLVGLLGTATAQSTQSVNDYMLTLRAGETPATDLPMDPAVRAEWVPVLAGWLRDTVYTAAYTAGNLLQMFGTTSPYPATRQAAADALAAEVILQFPQAANAARWLHYFDPQDFSEDTREALRLRFPTYAGPHYREMAWLVGYLELHELLPELQTDLAYLQGVDRWKTFVVQTRLGDPKARTKVHWILDRAGVNADALELLYPDVPYTRDSTLITRLVDIVLTDEHRCASPNYYAPEPISCAYLAMEFLPDLIAGFPYEKDAAGQLDTDDYATALTDIRRWFAQHPAWTLKELP